MSLLGFGMGIMFASIHVCEMMLYMLVRYVSPRSICGLAAKCSTGPQ